MDGIYKMTSIKDIKIEDYSYSLPDESIAQSAIEPRDKSKLLCYKKNKISHTTFCDIHELVPRDAQMYMNDAKVIPARLFVKNTNGANIEIFLLQPFQMEYINALSNNSNSTWKCLIGNKKKWKKEELLHTIVANTTIEITLLSVEENIVKFSWNDSINFMEILQQWGKIPLPPYIKRETNTDDKQRYQTVYSSVAGSVAAPTAGLHFTKEVLNKLSLKGVANNFLTLHVSAGTFLPVKTSLASEHQMHTEYFSISLETLLSLQIPSPKVAVGTTSVRVLESLYWCAVKITNNLKNPFSIEQWAPYSEYNNVPSVQEAITCLIKHLQQNKLTHLHGDTSIMIMPGYSFRFVDILITNFHQPKSTLLLLIAAFVGDVWREIYTEALLKEYRFLSYGDSSILFRH